MVCAQGGICDTRQQIRLHHNGLKILGMGSMGNYMKCLELQSWGTMHQGALPQYWGCLELHAAIGHALSSLIVATVWSNSAVFSKKWV